MDRLRHKQKKEKPPKNVDKEKAHSFIRDVKTIQENLKIKEIMRTVRMNVPRGSRVPINNDFNDKESFFDEEHNSADGQQKIELLSATNLVMFSEANNDSNVTENNHILHNCTDINSEVNYDDNDVQRNEENLDIVHENTNEIVNEISKDEEVPLEDTQEIERIPTETPDVPCTQKDPENKKIAMLKNRERKLSLDQTMLTRRISQSELDLHSIGKSPLERKSSFFKKKLDSFLKNTTEIFKRQALINKVELENPRGSMSVSLQSLNEKTEVLLKNDHVSNIFTNPRGFT